MTDIERQIDHDIVRASTATLFELRRTVEMMLRFAKMDLQHLADPGVKAMIGSDLDLTQAEAERKLTVAKVRLDRVNRRLYALEYDASEPFDEHEETLFRLWRPSQR